MVISNRLTFNMNSLLNYYLLVDKDSLKGFAYIAVSLLAKRGIKGYRINNYFVVNDLRTQ